MDRIGVLTSGGDAPGMNTAVRAVTRAAIANSIEAVGIEDGYGGLLHGRFTPLSARDVGGILHRGGTKLRTARCDAMFTEEGRSRALRQLRRRGIDGLLIIGGDGSLRGAHELAARGVHTVGIPASIDNDIWGTDMSIGVDTALNTIMEVMDKLRDTASSHQRTFLIETMGRNCGYLALMAGVIGGAVFVVAPEMATTLDEVSDVVASAYERGKRHAFVVVAEGASLGVQAIAAHLDDQGKGFEPRITTLGHVQRGGSPSAFDRMLASKMGVAAVTAVKDGATGVMTALKGASIELVPLPEIGDAPKAPSLEHQQMTQVLSL